MGDNNEQFADVNTWGGTRNLSPFASFDAQRIVSRFPNRIKFFDTLGLENSVNIDLRSFKGLYSAYRTCRPVASVINRLAEAAMVGQWRVIDVQTKDDLSTEHEYAALIKLLVNPNPLQTCQAFISQMDIYKHVFGKCYIYANVPTRSGSVREAVSLWVIKPDDIEPIYSTKLFNATRKKDIIESYKINYTIGKTSKTISNINPDHVLIITDTPEELYTEDAITGISRLCSLENDIRIVMQAQNTIIETNIDRGALGIISNDKRDAIGFTPYTDEERKALHNQFKKDYGLRRGQNKVLITDAAVKYQEMGFNLKDLMSFEGIRESVMGICDAYNYPFDLMASEKGKTAADKRAAVKMLYEDNVIPNNNKLTEQISNWLGFDILKSRIIMDFSHLDVFQEGNVERNNALRQMAQAMHIAYNSDVITLQEFRRRIGLPPELPEGTLRSTTAAQSSRDDVRITTS